MATQWFSNMVMDEPSFFHQWQSDGLLEQYTEQQIAVAFGQAGEADAAAAGGGDDGAAAAVRGGGGGGAPAAEGGEGEHQLGLVHHGAGLPGGLLLADHPLLRRPRRRRRRRGVPQRGAGAERPVLRRRIPPRP
ncbi:hypothetical protein OsJ_12416 [Oryza sativa Japonica Group]|uniref:Uncharacterized protein n=1 Tax=Oryza sativa subsp. japonica TaxID=39947 RepID=B9FBA5_ORYSJ|nr:hypothetical protein OsJ_12416 [Oryza sativa Japonica Group]